MTELVMPSLSVGDEFAELKDLFPAEHAMLARSHPNVAVFALSAPFASIG